ncbi:mitogen-activated protein kinase kinase kinase 15-like isoform X2 [Paramacrobiotus metropolitanus]|uniref:mitogen-activated protein kinase kinase kinase 15-like isoform X2 n=1 Tax=Paramacrobiotus metropolitanus TaxID=2943436 RepID=UPI002446217C|nr:mitogen-activated protein kinase kinase kinase 15-like isoform X2 [Paramacrobiotus metropolitanus]
MGNQVSSADSKPEEYGRSMQYRYRHADLIGRGSFGVVYKAKVTKRGNYTGEDIVAVKVVHIGYVETAPDHDNWVAAAKRLRKLTELFHENLVVYHKVAITKASGGTTIELAMEYHQGDLASFLKEAEKTENHLHADTKLKQFATDIVRGLEYLHQNGIIHGDLKPENILVHISDDGHETLLIGDLDDLVQMREISTCSADISQLRGTTRYMSPEMLKKFSQEGTEAPGRTTDIWSLGCIVLEMAESFKRLPKKRLIRGGKIVDVAKDQTNLRYARLIIEGFVPFISDEVEENTADLIRNCLDPVSKNRLSAKELLHKLERKEVIVFLLYCGNDVRQSMVFDPANSSFCAEDTLSKPTPSGLMSRYWLQLAATDTEIVFTEGIDRLENIYGKFSFWDVGNGTCRELTPSLDIFFHMHPIVVNQKLYVWDYFDSFQEMDIFTGQVVRLKDPPAIARDGNLGYIQAVAKRGKHIFYATFPGMHRHNTVTMHQYDTGTNEWKSLPDLPKRRDKFAMVVVDGHLYVLGGEIAEPGGIFPTADCIRLNLDTGAWDQTEALGQPRYPTYMQHQRSPN